jgi:hypothetical protein
LITYLLDKPLGNRGFLVLQLKIKHTMAERSIVDVGNYLKRFYRVGENPAFGGVGGGHSPTGYHPKGLAIDVTDWRPDMAPAYEGGPKLDWKTRTGNLSWRAKQLGVFNEALGPGDKGHDTHVHMALEGKKFLTDPQLEWLATGRYKTPEGKLTDIMPGASTQPISSENPGSVNTQEFLVGYLLGTGFAGEPKESGATKMKRQLVQQLLQPAQTINPMELMASLPNPYAV